MKLLTILFLLPVLVQAQTYHYEQPKEVKEKTWYRPFISNNDMFIYGIQVVGGAAGGLHEVLVNHPHTFERVWPSANMNWWLPKLSQGRGGLVMIRDGYHFTHAIEHGVNYISIAISVADLKAIPKKQWPLLFAKRALLTFVFNRIGFNAVYKYGFNDRIERQRAGLDVD